MSKGNFLLINLLKKCLSGQKKIITFESVMIWNNNLKIQAILKQSG